MDDRRPEVTDFTCQARQVSEVGGPARRYHTDIDAPLQKSGRKPVLEADHDPRLPRLPGKATHDRIQDRLRAPRPSGVDDMEDPARLSQVHHVPSAIREILVISFDAESRSEDECCQVKVPVDSACSQARDAILGIVVVPSIS